MELSNGCQFSKFSDKLGHISSLCCHFLASAHDNEPPRFCLPDMNFLLLCEIVVEIIENSSRWSYQTFVTNACAATNY